MIIAPLANTLGVLTTILVSVVLPVLAALAAIWVIASLFKGVGYVFSLIGRFISHVITFAVAQATEVIQLAGGMITFAVAAPLALGNLALGRRRAAARFGRDLEEEFIGAGTSLYRLLVGNPARLLGLKAIPSDLENRLPGLGSERPLTGATSKSRRSNDGAIAFEGYTVGKELVAGGSGARLFLATPSRETLQRYGLSGHSDPGQVVIKSFALVHGSTLPQIVRESRALEAARSLGLVLDHELTEDTFWYAMPYVPGDDLDVITRRMHARTDPAGLGKRGIDRLLGFSNDILVTLDRFHEQGLWHKDIKPSNLIVSGDRVHLVDLGLVTPLASAMTLTTHGTEYFRDPELVRRALQGVKVREIDGVKFDIYSAGAVLYSMIENSFPAHGSLSRFSKRCPDALAFIVRRAMADIDDRYASAREMSADIEALIAAGDVFAFRPADLPSMSGSPAPAQASLHAQLPPRPTPASPRPARVARSKESTGRRKAKLRPVHFLIGISLGIAGSIALYPNGLHPRGSWVVQDGSIVRRPEGGHRSTPSWISVNGGSTTVTVGPRARTGEVADFLAAGSRPQSQIDEAFAWEDPKDRPFLLLRHLEVTDDRLVQEARDIFEARGIRYLDETNTGDEANEMLAAAKKAAGLAPIYDETARGRLEDFLRDHSELGGVMWVGRDRAGSLSFRFLPHPGESPEVVPAEGG